jgi:hypothetical protein
METLQNQFKEAKPRHNKDLSFPSRIEKGTIHGITRNSLQKGSA